MNPEERMVAEEVRRFARKAERYRRALERYPAARTFEVIPILAALDRLLDFSPRGAVTLCDVMAGTGFLAGRLVSLGCRVVAAEACRTLVEGGPDQGFERFSFQSADQIPEVLHDLSCDIALSHVAFHHVFRKSGPAVDRDASVELQSELIQASFDRCPKLQAFIVSDVPVGGGCTTGDFPWGPSRAFRGHQLIREFSPEIADAFGTVTGADEYDRLLAEYAPAGQPRVTEWFRQVVDPHSLVGHDDCFLGGELPARLRECGFRVSSRVFLTPWLFRDEDELTDDIWDQFGFDDAGGLWSPRDSRRAANDFLGIRSRSGVTTLGWRLQYLVITRPNGNSP